MNRFQKNADRYQAALIVLGIVTTALFLHFFLRELFPQYKLFQTRFDALENFRADLDHAAPPSFNYGVKQLVFEREDRGPAHVDRCTSCHLALEIEEYSPTIVAKDLHNQILYNEEGFPKQILNPKYLFSRLDERILELQKMGDAAAIEALVELKTIESEGKIYEAKKVLSAHPLIGRETRPFQYHPIEEYGCTSCHSGNGNGLTVDKAHGPLYDGTYEEEFVGYTPQFLEKDLKNDPPFSKLYNHKPGSKLLFQTTPLFIGGLIEAKCVQCHLTSKQEKEIVGNYLEDHHLLPSKLEGSYKLPVHEIDPLISHYQMGEELFFTQACYACHKIEGLARGGVGPDLTREGFSHPWFVKESIVWPQADLKTSTMPNFRLDHDDVEDLMTFLMAQKGERRAFSGTPYKKAITAWENGRKIEFEKPISSKEVTNLDYAMELFAEGGCASCHRLEGYKSQVQFSDEKAKTWFVSHVPEEITGDALVSLIDGHSEEIDQGFMDNKKPKVLDRIEAKIPGLLSTFYPPFQYAKRKNGHLQYQERLQKLLLGYIEVYGLGRQIGPKLSWSGIYRSDPWLINHFMNPGSEVPRSIMPKFPYDMSKFTALTEMLNQLAQENIKALRQKWSLSGFQPSLAYQTLCMQCHGEYLQGDGPVSEWIYPIPKNLNSAEFMRNLTKERLVDSILHGVAGTPMPPWGEIASGKQEKNGSAVLTPKEAEALANWLLSSLPGENIVQDDIPKWRYKQEDLLRELQGEKSPFTSHTILEKGMIKKSLYTPENIEKGRAFFIENCAACHGKEADGQGLRQEAMHDAKPRMLTNVHWLESRDDLRLLRSIKYGVPGTSMTPWGDLTTAEIRLDLVMYIRSLSEEKIEQNRLQEALYKKFDQKIFDIQRGVESGDEAALKKEKQMFQALGLQILSNSSGLRDELFPLLLQALSPQEKAIDPKVEEMVALISHQIEKLKKEGVVRLAKLPTEEGNLREKRDQVRLSSLEKLRATIQTVEKELHP